MTEHKSSLQKPDVKRLLDKATPPTICRCGLAKSYHEGRFTPGHAYEPRYEPMAWREGYRAAANRLPDYEATVEALRAWVDLCHDYDLNEQGQTVIAELRAALACLRET